jgi:alkylated DNA repair dioxygenase AlkB
VFYQGSLFGTLTPPAFDATFVEAVRWPLDATSWVEHVPGWLSGSDQVFDELSALLPLSQRAGARMCDRPVDEPRLSARWTDRSGGAEPMALLADVRRALAERYDEAFDSIGFDLYRDGADSVAWRTDRSDAVDPVVAIVSVGSPRPFRLRPKRGGRSYAWSLGHGDLFVMGGACRTLWEHTVPKVRVTTGPCMTVTFRAGRRNPTRLDPGPSQ